MSALAVSSMILAGCDAGERVEPGQWGDFEQLAGEIRDDARQAGAAPRQLDLIDRAMADGAVSVEIEREALENLLECFGDAGVRSREEPVSETRGFPEYSYSVLESDAEKIALADTCVLQEFDFVDSLYVFQPSSREAEDLRFSRARPQLDECLRGAGIATPDVDATNAEYQAFLVEQLTGDSTVIAEVNWCLYDAGIDAF